MQFCYNCGKFFPDEDVVQRRDGETALHIYCCPHCGVDDIGEAETCSLCGKDFADGETREGFCLECLWNAITYDIALAYMKDADCLPEFFLTGWGCGKLEHSSPEFNAFLEETFKRSVANDKLLSCYGGKSDFLRECRYWILPNYDAGDFGVEGSEFAEWYADYLKKGAKK